MNSIKLRGVVAAVSGVLMFGAMPVMADSTDDIINALIGKGVLTEEEGALLMRGRTGEKEAAEEKKKSEVKAKFKDGIVLESGDGKHSLTVNGRVHADYRNYFGYEESNTSATSTTHVNTASTGADTFDIRRARIGVKAKFYDYYEMEAVANLTGSAPIMDVAYLNVAWWKPVQFRMGQFKMPMNLEEQTSSNNIDFIERSVVNQFAPAKEVGAMVHGQFGKGFTYALAASNGAGQNNAEADSRVDGKDVIGRVTANVADLLENKEMVLHAGLSYSRGDIPEGSLGRIRTESRGANYLTMPTVNDVDNDIERRRLGLEGAVAYGPFKAQAEWFRTSYDFETAAASYSPEVKAWYAEALWMITGEKYADFYKNGAFGGLKPKNNFDPESGKTGWGLWEVGVRYSRLDADDLQQDGLTGATADAGISTKADGHTKSSTWTAGIKFLPTPNMRLMVNYVRTKYDDLIATSPVPVSINGTTEDSERALLMRAQWMF